jgi:hypothetical protein
MRTGRPTATCSDWSFYPISLETLFRLRRHVLVDCVELLAPLSFRLLDRFESCEEDREVSEKMEKERICLK